MFTGVDLGDFLLGLPNQTFYDVVKQDNDGISGHYNAFAQDEWKVSPKLTLTYGVRYELHPGYYDKYGDIGNFDPTVALSGRAIYPQGKQALLSQAFLASANACDPISIATIRLGASRRVRVAIFVELKPVDRAARQATGAIAASCGSP